jgi:hypothetical protein
MKNLKIRSLVYIMIVLAMAVSYDVLSQDVLVASAEKKLVVAPAEDPIVTEGEKDEAKKAEEQEDGTLSISGYLDSYFFHNFNNPASRDNMGQSGVGRGFDRRVDQFALGMVQTIFTYKNKKSEMVADLAFGPSAQYGNYGNVPNLSPAYGWPVGNDVLSGIMIKQAYWKYNVNDKFSFAMGQWGTHIGYELIDAPLNFFYSINHTFNSGIPFYHTGIKGQYAFSDKVSLMLGLVNGFDYIQDNNRAKGLIGQLSLAPAEGLTVYLNYISTNEANADATGNTPDGNFTVYDVNGSYAVSDKFTIAYWAMLGTQRGDLGSPGVFVPADGNVDEKKSWYGANLYLIYALSDYFSIGTRLEYFNNDSGARGLRNYTTDASGNVVGLGASCNTLTFTGSATLADGHLLLKPEFRIDAFTKLDGAGNEQSQQFMDADGNYTKNSQSTLGMAAIYKF